MGAFDILNAQISQKHQILFLNDIFSFKGNSVSKKLVDSIIFIFHQLMHKFTKMLLCCCFKSKLLIFFKITKKAIIK